MRQRWYLLAVVVILCALIAGCQPASSEGTDKSYSPVSTGGAELPNPATAYCEEQGYTSEIRTAADGSQSGVCIFPDGSECDEWAFYRGECGPESGE
jgi:putative hemolysin